MRIYPINIKQKTWHNYSNYLNWVSKDIVSLKDYIKVFNPDFQILNQDLHSCSSSTWSEFIIEGTQETENLFTELNYNEDYVYVCFPSELSYRQGIFAPQVNHFACLDYSYKSQPNNLIKDWDARLNDRTLIPLEPNQVIILTRKTQGLNSNISEIKEKLSSYLILSQPSAGLYKIQNVMNGIMFNFVENGQAALGGNINFVIELTPTRYFISDTSKNSYWGQYAKEWNIQGGYWANTNADLSLIVQNKLGSIWTNSYPLAHKIYLQTEQAEGINSFEEFIFDHSFNTKEISISSHNTSLYTITTNFTDQDADTDLLKKVYVSIT